MAETHKIYTSYPTGSTHNYPKYEPNPWGLAFFLLIIGFVVIMWSVYRLLEWWDGLGTGYNYDHRKSYHYNADTQFHGAEGNSNTNNTTTLAKPKANKWNRNPLWKPKPVVAPRMCVAGRMNGVEFNNEGPDEAKYLDKWDRDRYYEQKGIYGKFRAAEENKVKNDVYNGT